MSIFNSINGNGNIQCSTFISCLLDQFYTQFFINLFKSHFKNKKYFCGFVFIFVKFFKLLTELCELI